MRTITVVAGAARDGVDGRPRQCRRVVRELPARRFELRLFFGRAMLGHRARPRRWILRPKPLPGDGLRVGRKLEYSQLETLSAQLLGPHTHRSSFVSAACPRKRPKQVVVSRR